MTRTNKEGLVESEQHLAHPEGYGSTDNAPCIDDTDTDQNASFAKKFRQLKQKSTCHTDLVRNVLLFLFGHFIWTIILFLTLTVPVAMIIIGAVFVKECPAKPPIPIIMIIMGSLMMLSNVLHLANRFHAIWDYTLPTRLTGLGLITATINLLSFICFIAGCIWVYSIYPPSYNKLPNFPYCDKTLYLFSFWTLTSVYIFFGIIFVMTFIGCCLALCFAE